MNIEQQQAVRQNAAGIDGSSVLSEQRPVTLVVIGKMSPPIYSCLQDFGADEQFTVYFIDIKSKQAPFYATVLKNFSWLSYESNWSERLLDIANKDKAAVYVTCVSYFLAKKIRALPVDNIRLLYANDAQITLAEDKQLQNQLAEKHNLAVLPSWYLPPGTTVPAEITYPVVIRPTSELSQANFKVEVVDSSAQLRQFSDRYPVVAQPLLAGKKLLVHCARNPTQTVISVYEVTASFQGLTLALKIVPHPPASIITACTAMLNDLNYVGVCHFDLIGDDTVWYFLDLNLRLGGTTNKVRFLNNREGTQLLKTFFNQPLTTPPLDSTTEITNKIEVVKALYAVLTDKWTRIDYPAKRKMPLIGFLFKKIFLAKDEIFNTSNLRFSFFKILTIVCAPFKYLRNK